LALISQPVQMKPLPPPWFNAMSAVARGKRCCRSQTRSTVRADDRFPTVVNGRGLARY
jgi:hypothetical protein